MIENRAEIDNILTRAGLPRVERERLIDCGDARLAGQLQGAGDVGEIKRLVGEFYADQKATVDGLEDE